MALKKRALSLLLAGVLALGCVPVTAEAESSFFVKEQPADGTTQDQPFVWEMDAEKNSKIYRIPALVCAPDGSLIAAADARWDVGPDGGGLDTVVSRSTDDGKNWQFSFVNYMGDYGDTWNKRSTAFIDASLAVDERNQTVWMICDLYPAGISISKNNTQDEAKGGSTGYNENHQLLLAMATETLTGISSSDARSEADFAYHLEKIEGAADDAASYYQIVKNSDQSIVEGYQIDAYFHISNEEGTVNTNLFFENSPYFPYPTDYVYIKKSTDNGQTWSIPTLADVKKKNEQTILVGPGHGIVTSAGRIIFNCYEYTGGDKSSSIIYSDDQGATWHRGASVSGTSSESVVVEADGRLYMFVRRNNVYYVSEDNGDTWSQPKATGITYHDGCQLSAITYSKKVNGKTAIIFSAPTNGRNAGKLFVGLVEADGTISWQENPYQVKNTKYAGNDHYGYSCLAETKDGDIALVYENYSVQASGAQPKVEEIEFQKIPISDVLGNDPQLSEKVWLSDSQKLMVSDTKIIGSDQTVKYSVNCSDKDAAVTVSSSNRAVLEASYDAAAKKLILSSKSNVSGLKEVKVTVTAGEAQCILNVTVAEQENYKVISLEEGEEKSILFEGELTAEDIRYESEGITDVTIGTAYLEETYQGQTASAENQFNGKKVDLPMFLYTLGSTGTENTYTLKSTNASIYLTPGADAQKPHQTSAESVRIGQKTGEALFSLFGTSASRYLYFHRNTTHLFDRNSEVAENCYFELYTPILEGSTDTSDGALKGYRKIQNLAELREGMNILVLPPAEQNGERYLACASTSTSNYHHVAKLLTQTVSTETNTEVAVHPSTANGVFDSAKKNGLSDCLYTFEKNGNTYKIYAYMEDGKRVYLSLADARIPNSTTAADVYVSAGNTEGTVSFSRTANADYLYFHKASTGDKCLTFNRNSHKNNIDHCDFELFEQTSETTANAETGIPGYKKVAFSDITDGGRYLIARKAEDQNYYVLSPSTETVADHAYRHTAKVSADQTYTDPKKVQTTTIDFSGTTQGKTCVTIKGTMYYVFVNRDGEQLPCSHENTVYVDGVAATCGAEGTTGDEICIDCGTVVNAAETIPATGNHSFGSWSVVKEPTTAETGLKIRYCENCNHPEEQVLDKLPENQAEKLPEKLPENQTDKPSKSQPTAGNSVSNSGSHSNGSVGTAPKTGDMADLSMPVMTAVAAAAMWMLCMFEKRKNVKNR